MGKSKIFAALLGLATLGISANVNAAKSQTLETNWTWKVVYPDHTLMWNDPDMKANVVIRQWQCEKSIVTHNMLDGGVVLGLGGMNCTFGDTQSKVGLSSMCQENVSDSDTQSIDLYNDGVQVTLTVSCKTQKKL